jgi:hypothetical protein
MGLFYTLSGGKFIFLLELKIMKNNQSSLILVLAFILSLALTGYFVIGFTGILFSAAFIGGFILWILTTYRYPVDINKFIIPYLVMIVFFVIHVTEERLAHIETELSRMAGTEISKDQFLNIATTAGPIVWLLGAIMSLKRWPFGYFLASTFLFGMMFAELSHFINPFMEDGTFHYTAGMYTALLPVIAGWYTFRIIKADITEQKRLKIKPQ